MVFGFLQKVGYRFSARKLTDHVFGLGFGFDIHISVSVISICRLIAIERILVLIGLENRLVVAFYRSAILADVANLAGRNEQTCLRFNTLTLGQHLFGGLVAVSVVNRPFDLVLCITFCVDSEADSLICYAVAILFRKFVSDQLGVNESAFLTGVGYQSGNISALLITNGFMRYLKFTTVLNKMPSALLSAGTEVYFNGKSALAVKQDLLTHCNVVIIGFGIDRLTATGTNILDHDTVCAVVILEEFVAALGITVIGLDLGREINAVSAVAVTVFHNAVAVIAFLVNVIVTFKEGHFTRGIQALCQLQKLICEGLAVFKHCNSVGADDSVGNVHVSVLAGLIISDRLINKISVGVGLGYGQCVRNNRLTSRTVGFSFNRVHGQDVAVFVGLLLGLVLQFFGFELVLNKAVKAIALQLKLCGTVIGNSEAVCQMGISLAIFGYGLNRFGKFETALRTRVCVNL